MSWLNICQGLVFLGWFVRMVGGFFHAWAGRDAQKPTGAFGIIFTVLWSALTAVVIWRAGGVSTMIGGGGP